MAFVGLGSRLNGGGGIFGQGEANEAILVGLVLCVEGDLDTHDLSVFGEFLVQILAGEVLGDLSHKHVLLGQLGLLVAQELWVEGEGSALLAFDDWVLELLKHFLEAFLVVDLDHGGIEVSTDVSLDLGFNVDVNSCFVFNDFGDLYFGH